MQVFESCDDLKSALKHLCFSLVRAPLQELEKVAVRPLHHQPHFLLILEYIVAADEARMLTLLQQLALSRKIAHRTPVPTLLVEYFDTQAGRGINKQLTLPKLYICVLREGFPRTQPVFLVERAFPTLALLVPHT
jgi:hypothetical protein